MATKLDLLLSFATGQGISGGASNYVNYPADLDSNYSAIQTTVNQMIDELTAARLTDSEIPRDILFPSPDGLTAGRYTQNAARITRSGNSVIIASGLIHAAGRRIDVTGQTFDFTSLAIGTYRIACDATGVLSTATSAGTQTVDIAVVAWDGSLVDADVTDNLYNDGVTLTSDPGYVQGLAPPPGIATSPFAATYDHRVNPPIRKIDTDGTLGDSGFFVGPDATDDRWFWVSQRAGGHGIGDTVLAAIYADLGQTLLLEQGRCFVVKADVDQTITSAAEGTWASIEFDTLPAANVAAAPERFEPESYFASTSFQSGVSNVNFVIPANPGLNGTWFFTAVVVWAANATGQRDARIFKTATGTQLIGRNRVEACSTGSTVNSISGVFDLQNTDTISLQVQQNSGGNLDVTFARLTAVLIGGGV